MHAGVDELVPIVGVAAACQALSVPRATYYRHRARPADGAPAPLLPDGDTMMLVGEDLTSQALTPPLLAQASVTDQGGEDRCSPCCHPRA